MIKDERELANERRQYSWEGGQMSREAFSVTAFLDVLGIKERIPEHFCQGRLLAAVRVVATRGLSALGVETYPETRELVSRVMAIYEEQKDVEVASKAIELAT